MDHTVTFTASCLYPNDASALSCGDPVQVQLTGHTLTIAEHDGLTTIICPTVRQWLQIIEAVDHYAEEQLGEGFYGKFDVGDPGLDFTLPEKPPTPQATHPSKENSPNGQN